MKNNSCLWEIKLRKWNKGMNSENIEHHLVAIELYKCNNLKVPGM